ncbi:hypothetical protein NQZ68_042338 [Dissostichus eleginoides]|nr:hypothetical protein NQZ68_042338 [Dissostichus eleginoides]
MAAGGSQKTGGALQQTQKREIQEEMRQWDRCDESSGLTGVMSHQNGTGVMSHQDGTVVMSHQDGTGVMSQSGWDSVMSHQDGTGVMSYQDGTGVMSPIRMGQEEVRNLTPRAIALQEETRAKDEARRKRRASSPRKKRSHSSKQEVVPVTPPRLLSAAHVGVDPRWLVQVAQAPPPGPQLTQACP